MVWTDPATITPDLTGVDGPWTSTLNTLPPSALNAIVANLEAIGFTGRPLGRVEVFRDVTVAVTAAYQVLLDAAAAAYAIPAGKLLQVKLVLPTEVLTALVWSDDIPASPSRLTLFDAGLYYDTPWDQWFLRRSATGTLQLAAVTDVDPTPLVIYEVG